MGLLGDMVAGGIAGGAGFMADDIKAQIDRLERSMNLLGEEDQAGAVGDAAAATADSYAADWLTRALGATGASR